MTSSTLTAVALIIGVVLIVGFLSHFILLAGVALIAFFIGKSYAEGRLALGRRKARGSLGK